MNGAQQQREQRLTIPHPFLKPDFFGAKDPLFTMHISTCVSVAALKEFVSMEQPTHLLTRLTEGALKAVE